MRHEFWARSLWCFHCWQCYLLLAASGVPCHFAFQSCASTSQRMRHHSILIRVALQRGSSPVFANLGLLSGTPRRSDGMSSASSSRKRPFSDGSLLQQSLSSENSVLSGSMAVVEEREVGRPLVIVIAGVTAVGKSSVAAKLCRSDRASQILGVPSVEGHVVSADSVQAYKGVQIGANKPSESEQRATPHHLIDVADEAITTYNAADWMGDAIHVISKFTGTAIQNSNEKERAASSDEDTEGDDLSGDERCLRGERRNAIDNEISKTIAARAAREGSIESSGDDTPILPIVVGGTMMYLQWLVHGRPDAKKPTLDALARAQQMILKFQAMDDSRKKLDHETSSDDSIKSKGWEAAINHASSLGAVFADRVVKLGGNDWYRLRRTLEVAYTVGNNPTEEQIRSLYNGQRMGGLEALGFDVRCFFLCPDDRMAHAKVVDLRCEQMLQKGLLKETTDLWLSGKLLPDGQLSRAIGYRQTLDYLQRPDAKMGDIPACEAYLNDFTTATRRYAKKQMQWFRRDPKFLFVPISLSDPDRVDKAAETIANICLQTRDQFEKELQVIDSDDDPPLSARTKQINEEQGPTMKFYIGGKRHILLPSSSEFDTILEEADACTQRMQQIQSIHQQ